MKITQKLRQAILDEVAAGTRQSLDRFAPECRESPPEDWDITIKRRFDLICATEEFITDRLETLLS